VDPGGVSYQLSTDGGTTFSDWIAVANSGGNDVNISVDIADLSSASANHLNWRALDEAGNLIKVSNPIVITVKPPDQETKVPPTTLLTPDNQSVIKTLTPTFTWSLGDYSGNEDVIYHFHISKDDPDPQDSVAEERNLVKTSHTLTYELEDGATYYWTVFPVIGGIKGRCTNDPFSFTTSVLVDLKREITFSLETENLKVLRGQEYVINLTVTNEGEITETVTLYLSAADDSPPMVEMDKSSLTIMPGDSKVVKITLTPAEDCPTEIFVYTIRGDYDAGTVTKELTLVVEAPSRPGDDDDDGGGSGAFLAVLLIILLLVIIVIVVVVVVLMRRARRQREEEEVKAPKEVKKGKSAKKQDVKEEEEEPIEESVDAAPYTLTSPDALDAEMETAADIFEEAAFHKGYETAKKRMGGEDDILDLDLPIDDQLALDPAPHKTEIKSWDVPELDLTNMPGTGAPVLALPPAVFLDMEDTGGEKPYKIEEILMMDNNGILLSHYSMGTSINVDEDILAGMITAIQSFVKESFSTGGKGLSDLAMGDFRIFISPGSQVTFVTLVSGEGYQGIKKQLDRAVKDTEKKFSEQLKDWNGDISNLAGIEDVIKDFLEGKYE
jgi:hypothetical protein